MQCLTAVASNLRLVLLNTNILRLIEETVFTLRYLDELAQHGFVFSIDFNLPRMLIEFNISRLSTHECFFYFSCLLWLCMLRQNDLSDLLDMTFIVHLSIFRLEEVYTHLTALHWCVQVIVLEYSSGNLYNSFLSPIRERGLLFFFLFFEFLRSYSFILRTQ